MKKNDWLSLPRGLHPGADIPGVDLHGIHLQTIRHFSGGCLDSGVAVVEGLRRALSRVAGSGEGIGGPAKHAKGREKN